MKITNIKIVLHLEIQLIEKRIIIYHYKLISLNK